jgi:molecular chaperone HscB
MSEPLGSRLFEQNYFELFDLPVAYIVASDALGSRYRELQQQTHPDRFVTASEPDRLQALQQASRVNEAYTTLKSPLQRARYLLELRHLPMDDTNTRMDGAFLMTQMELREALAEVPEHADPLAALDTLRREVKGTLKQLEADLTRLFGENSREADEKAWDNVRKMQFLQKISQELDQTEQQLLQ